MPLIRNAKRVLKSICNIYCWGIYGIRISSLYLHSIYTLHLFKNVIEALKDLFLFPVMKLSLKWQTKKVALGTKYLMVLKITQVEVNTTWMTLMVRTVLLVPIGHEMLEMN